MMRVLLSTALAVFFVTIASAQTFTFACMDSTQLTGINCDVCPVTNITSRSFCGLLIYKSGTPYKWIDQPYTARQKPGNSVEYLEQIPSIQGIQTQDRITISLSGTSFFTVQGMIDSTVCHCATGIPSDTSALFYASDSTDFAPIYRGDTLIIVGRGVASVTFDSLLRKYVVFVDSVSGGGGGGGIGLDTLVVIAPAAGFTIAGSPAQDSRDTLTFTLANDLAALEALADTGIVVRTGTETYALRKIVAGTGVTITNGSGVSGNPAITNSAPSLWTDGGVFTYLTSTTDRAVVGSATEINTAYIFQAKGGIFSQGGGSTSATFAGVFEKADGTDILNIRNDGRVGILNSAPAYTLDVVGDIRIDQPSAYYLETTKMAYGKPSSDQYFFAGAGNVTGTATKVIGIGNSALLSFTTGINNVAIGYHAGRLIAGGQGNLAIGTEALKTNVSGDNNFAIGSETLKVATGSKNMAVGTLSMQQTTTGANNCAVGYYSLNGNTIGASNTVVGNSAMQFNTDGVSNVAIGESALFTSSTGDRNVSIGRESLYASTGDDNVAIGRQAGVNLSSGNRNVLIGAAIHAPSATGSNQVSIANIIFATGADGTGTTVSSGSVGIKTNAPSQALHVSGNLRVTGAYYDSANDPGTAGQILSSTATGTDWVAAATSYTDEQAQDAVGNILVDGTTIDFTYNDATPSITAEVINNSISNAKIRQGVARSVVGVTGNALANVADIQGTTDQVLRVNGAGTALAFGQVATGGISDDAVTYGKIQNVAANNVLLGNDSGAGSDVQELSTAEVQTMLGYIDGGGANQRIAYFTDANTVAAEAAFLYDAGNDRQTIVCTTPSFGAGAAILNLSNDGTDTNGEFLQMRGSITNLLTATMQNTSTAATSGVVLGISQSGNSAGDPYIQTQISGTGGNTTSFGMDNSDANKFKVSPNANSPGANADASLVATMDAIPLWGINKDAPGRMLDVGGDVRAINLVNTDSPPDASALGNGLGTGGTVDAVTGGNNGFTVTFTTGTGCVLDGPLFRLTFDNPFTITSHIIMDCHRDVDSIAECDKFLQNGTSPGFIDLKANGTLLDGKTHILKFLVIGQ